MGLSKVAPNVSSGNCVQQPEIVSGMKTTEQSGHVEGKWGSGLGCRAPPCVVAASPRLRSARVHWPL